MIYVTVGNHNAPFNRLLKWVDTIVPDLSDDIIWQVGVSTFRPQVGKAFRFCTSHEQMQYIQDARVVVTHGGVGSIIDIAKGSRPAVVVARLAAYGKHLNNHQTELASALYERGIITYARDQQSLRAALLNPALPVAAINLPNDLIGVLRQAIEQFAS
jgi:UDP-N-acetylglucosamine transferase subunit ALG13